MGQTQAKIFPQAQAIGSVNRPNDILSQSMAAPQLPQNALQPLIQNQIPFMQTANAVPNAPTAGSGGGGGDGSYSPMYAPRYDMDPFGFSSDNRKYLSTFQK